MPTDRVIDICHQAWRGIRFLQSQFDIWYTDVKPANIVWDTHSGASKIRICDVGGSAIPRKNIAGCCTFPPPETCSGIMPNPTMATLCYCLGILALNLSIGTTAEVIDLSAGRLQQIFRERLSIDPADTLTGRQTDAMFGRLGDRLGQALRGTFGELQRSMPNGVLSAFVSSMTGIDFASAGRKGAGDISYVPLPRTATEGRVESAFAAAIE